MCNSNGKKFKDNKYRPKATNTVYVYICNVRNSYQILRFLAVD